MASNMRSWREGLPTGLSGPISMLDEIKRANLRGRGGAGFTTALKWEACRNAPLKAGLQRILVCNADEGEPGTFKDRVLLAKYADLVFEGMTVAAYAVGATRGFVYLRGEYRYLLDHLNAVLAHRRRKNLLGKDILGIPGADFDIEIHVGAGAYVCGEESALIESLEGKRGTPRNRPPFPVTNGYLDQPTIVNNVETFAAAALIALNGGDWYAGSAPGIRREPRFSRCPAIARGPVCTNTPSASAFARCWKIAGRRIRRRCRSAARPASASPRTNSTASSVSRIFRRPAPSRSSTIPATCSRWRATTCISSSTRAAVSARRAASAPRC